MPDRSESIAAQVAQPDALSRIARWCAEDVLTQCLRAGHAPERYTDEAVIRRAEKDVSGDLASDRAFGFTATPEEIERYRSTYTSAYLSAWRDKALLADLRERRRRAPVGIVCCR